MSNSAPEKKKSATAQRIIRGWKSWAIPCLALGLGWGIRGSFGGPFGAMIPGVMLGTALAFVAGCTWRRALLVIAMSMLGMSFGGSQTIGQTVGHTKDDLETLVLPHAQTIEVSILLTDSTLTGAALDEKFQLVRRYDALFSTRLDSGTGKTILVCKDESHLRRVIRRLKREMAFDLATPVGGKLQPLTIGSEYMPLSSYLSSLAKVLIGAILFLLIWKFAAKTGTGWARVIRIFLVLFASAASFHYLIQPMLGLNYERIPNRLMLHWWGMLGLAIKGGLWMGMPGVLIGMAASRSQYTVKEIFLLLISALGAGALGMLLLNRPLSFQEGLFPPIYFSRWWDAKPRTESWAGLWAALLLLLFYAKYVKKDPTALKMGLWGIFAGQGWWMANYIQVWGHFTSLWNTMRWINWWGYMEIGFGLIAGAIWGLGWQRIERDDTDPAVQKQPGKGVLIALAIIIIGWIGIEFLAEENVMHLKWFGWNLWTNWWYAILMLLLVTTAWLETKWQLAFILVYCSWISTTNVGLKLVEIGLIPLWVLISVAVLVVVGMAALTVRFYKKSISVGALAALLTWIHIIFFWFKHYPESLFNVSQATKEAHGFFYWWYSGGSNSPLHIIMILMLIAFLMLLRSPKETQPVA
ncbi:hypothetical protein JXJ21_02800 [candidate division KSB1 bacterium]|nr:hypothetical protein [candidate division KSB1 bacterium]